MNITTRQDENASALDIHVEGRFDFQSHKAFRDSYRDAEGIRRIRVDLSRCEYLDSSALGMLLLLREHGNANGMEVSLAGPSAPVMRILEIAGFRKLFTIE